MISIVEFVGLILLQLITWRFTEQLSQLSHFKRELKQFLPLQKIFTYWQNTSSKSF